MRVLALADRRPKIPLKELLEKEVDLIITLGDLEHYDLRELEGLKVPRVGVYGNHCGDYMQELGIVNLHQSMWIWENWSFVGLEGCPRYKGGDHQFTQEQAARMIARWPVVDIVISHSPPYGVHDASHDAQDDLHHGWKALTEYIEWAKPRYVLHGHTYPEQETTVIDQTTVHYVHGYRYLELEKPL